MICPNWNCESAIILQKIIKRTFGEKQQQVGLKKCKCYQDELICLPVFNNEITDIKSVHFK